MNAHSDDDLMVRYLEGGSSADDVTLLETRLRTDPGARREFVRLAHLQALFVDLPRAAAAGAAPTPPDRRWHPARAASLAAAALVLVAITWFAMRLPPDLPSVTAVQGGVRCLRGQEVVPLRAGDTLQPGDQLALAGLATLSLSWREQASIAVEQYSILTVGAAGAEAIHLVSGAVHAVVIGHSGHAFAIATPDGVARDIGTDFTVRRDEDGTAVQVLAGLVMLENAQGRVTVPAGRSASVHVGRAPSLEVTPPRERLATPAVVQAPATLPTPPPQAGGGSPAVTGTVTRLDTQRRSFTVRDDRTGEASEYRAHFAGGHPEGILAQISGLHVGDRVQVGYIEREGRRAVTIVTAPPQDGK